MTNHTQENVSCTNTAKEKLKTSSEEVVDAHLNN